MGADNMAALRLTTATLCSSKQITKVFQSNLRILSSRGYKDSCESHSEVYQQKPKLLQSTDFSGSFRREFRTSSILGEAKVVSVPPFADSISEGDVRLDKAVGDEVKEDEEVCQIETDKTSIPVKAPFAGVISEIFVEDGATVQAGTKLFTPTPVAAPAPAAPAPAIPVTPPPRPSAPAAPKASIPAASIQPKVASLPTSQAVPLARVPPPDYSKEITGTRTEQRVEMNRMRLRIAQRLKEAQNTNAMLTTFNEIDMSNLMELRKTYGEQFFKAHGIKLGFMSAFVKASAYALTSLPAVNAVIDGNEIVYRDYVDISVAVATPKGLVVPVLRNLETMNYADIEKGIAALGEKAKKNQLAVEDMDGGTFTISNGGVF